MKTNVVTVSGMPDQAPGEIVIRMHANSLPDGMRSFSVFGDTPEEALQKFAEMLLEEAQRVYRDKIVPEPIKLSWCEVCGYRTCSCDI